MAPSLHRARSHVERGLARQFAQRSSITPRDSTVSSVAAAPSPSKTAPAGVTLPPHGTAALIGIVVTLSLFILAFSAWRVIVWRRKKYSATSSEFLEKKPGLYSPVDDTHNFKRSLSNSSGVANITLPAHVKAAVTRDRPPLVLQPNPNYQPKVVYSESQEKSQDALPSITITPAVPPLQITPPPLYVKTPSPVLSPRGSSKTHSVLPTSQSDKLPRLVIVESTFTANLHDELEIHVGETLRLLEEYEDEWCLVQRVGPANAEKGVIPCFCIVDKPVVPPTKKSKHIPRLSSTKI